MTDCVLSSLLKNLELPICVLISSSILMPLKYTALRMSSNRSKNSPVMEGKERKKEKK